MGRSKKINSNSINLSLLNNLSLIKPSIKKFPSLKLAYDVMKMGGLLGAVLNAAIKLPDIFVSENFTFNRVNKKIL